MAVKDFFKKGGYIEQVMPSFKQRKGQVELAELVYTSGSTREHVAGEGPTGFGKSFALLVGGILYAVENKKRLVISTGNISLQDQYLNTDLPTVEAAFKLAGISFTFAVAKGRSNFVCRAKLDEENTAFGSEAMKWAKSLLPMMHTGDVASAPAGAMKDWLEVGADADCERRGCPYYVQGAKPGGETDCFVFQAQRNYRDAQIVVTNHAMLIMDMRRNNVLGEYDMVIVDEAHMLPESAQSALTVEFTPRAISKEVSMCAKMLRRSGIRYFESDSREKYQKMEDHVFAELESYVHSAKRFDALPERSQMEIQKRTNVILDSLQEDWTNLINLSFAENTRELQARDAAATRLRELFDNLCKVTQINKLSKNWLSMVEGRVFAGRRYPVMKASPIEVAPLLNRGLFNVGRVVVMASATLRVDGNFGFMRRETGMPKEGTQEFVGESPFDFKKNMVVYAPTHLVSPEDRSYTPEVVDEVAQIISLRQGKALILFTSTAMMDKVCWEVQKKVPYACLKQGDAPKPRLVEEFKQNVSSCLFATKSFFEGFDVPGEALSTVVLVKCPFPVHTDPLYKARCDRVEEAGHSSFSRLSMPIMLNTFRQAYGRLIRSETDSGVFAILDSRALNKPYGKKMLKALPEGVQIIQKAKKLGV